MTHVDDVVRPDRRFAPDPLAPGRQRFWDSWHWTARVRDTDGTDGISWSPALAGLPRPPAPEAPTEPEAAVPGPNRRRTVMAVGAAAAAALIAAGAAAGAGVFTPSDQRPQIESRLSYRDVDAGFALRYPDDWRVLSRDRGNAIRFSVAAPGASTTETNTVSVVVGTNAADLPALHTLADQLTEMLRQQLPGARLESAARTRVADAPGFRFAFRDPHSTPATQIEQYVGRTASGKPLTVTVTVREPRTAPTQTELNDFLDSLRSGRLRARG